MLIRRIKSKYRNTSCQCMSKHIHDSRLEAAYCDQLRLLRKAKEIYSYQIQKRFDLEVNGQKICSHYVDFLVFPTEKDYLMNQPEVHETKGFATGEWKLKRKLFEALYPDIDYIVVTGRSDEEWKKRMKLLKSQLEQKRKKQRKISSRLTSSAKKRKST